MKRLTLKETLLREDRALRNLITLLADLSLTIAREIPRTLGSTKGVNIYGEKQLQLDVWSNNLITHKLLSSGLVKQVASEELEHILRSKRGEYSVVLDPLDGSSNITTDNLMGTIVGIYHDKELPAAGRDLLASMYFLYGPYLELVLANTEGVHVFVAAGKGSKGSEKFITDGEKRHFPDKSTVYGVGGVREKWTPKLHRFVESLEKRKLTLRYGGALVGDFNQVLVRGGFFAYPELLDAPLGKYRLNFESIPLALIAEKAGGKGSTGTRRILDVEPTDLAQKSPTYLGNADLVTEFEELSKPNLA